MKRYIIPVSIGIGLVIIATVVAGDLGWYDAIPFFDKLLHFSGGIIAGWISYIFMRRYVASAPRLVQGLFVLSGTALIGISWEFAEYLSSALDFYLAIEGYLYIGDLRDTIFDLVMDLTGGGLAALWHIKTRS